MDPGCICIAEPLQYLLAWGGFIVAGTGTGARNPARIDYCRVLLLIFSYLLSTQNRTNHQICRERKKKKKNFYALSSAYIISGG